MTVLNSRSTFRTGLESFCESLQTPDYQGHSFNCLNDIIKFPSLAPDNVVYELGQCVQVINIHKHHIYYIQEEIVSNTVYEIGDGQRGGKSRHR